MKLYNIKSCLPKINSHGNLVNLFFSHFLDCIFNLKKKKSTLKQQNIATEKVSSKVGKNVHKRAENMKMKKVNKMGIKKCLQNQEKNDSDIAQMLIACKNSEVRFCF